MMRAALISLALILALGGCKRVDHHADARQRYADQIATIIRTRDSSSHSPVGPPGEVNAAAALLDIGSSLAEVGAADEAALRALESCQVPDDCQDLHAAVADYIWTDLKFAREGLEIIDAARTEPASTTRDRLVAWRAAYETATDSTLRAVDDGAQRINVRIDPR